MMLTRCKKCGIEAHYRFEYILHKQEIGESMCRARYWKQWYRDSWTKYGVGQGAKGEIPEAMLLDVIDACVRLRASRRDSRRQARRGALSSPVERGDDLTPKLGGF